MFFSIFLGIGLSGMNFANYPTSQFMVFLTQYMFELDIKKSAEDRTHSKFKLGGRNVKFYCASHF